MCVRIEVSGLCFICIIAAQLQNTQREHGQKLSDEAAHM